MQVLKAYQVEAEGGCHVVVQVVLGNQVLGVQHDVGAEHDSAQQRKDGARGRAQVRAQDQLQEAPHHEPTQRCTGRARRSQSIEESVWMIADVLCRRLHMSGTQQLCRCAASVPPVCTHTCGVAHRAAGMPAAVAHRALNSQFRELQSIVPLMAPTEIAPMHISHISGAQRQHHRHASPQAELRLI